jgi:hypothetical protein
MTAHVPLAGWTVPRQTPYILPPDVSNAIPQKPFDAGDGTGPSPRGVLLPPTCRPADLHHVRVTASALTGNSIPSPTARNTDSLKYVTCTPCKYLPFTLLTSLDGCLGGHLHSLIGTPYLVICTSLTTYRSIATAIDTFSIVCMCDFIVCIIHTTVSEVISLKICCSYCFSRIF